MSSIQSEPVNASPARPWPADRSERWPIERLIFYANHARLHCEADLDKIAAAIRNWGWTMPPLVDENGVLIVGHARVGAAAKLGLAEVPVMITRGRHAPADRQQTAGVGSGTTLIAAEMTGRVCYALELNPAYVDVVVRRWHRTKEVQSKEYLTQRKLLF